MRPTIPAPFVCLMESQLPLLVREAFPGTVVIRPSNCAVFCQQRL